MNCHYFEESRIYYMKQKWKKMEIVQKLNRGQWKSGRGLMDSKQKNRKVEGEWRG